MRNSKRLGAITLSIVAILGAAPAEASWWSELLSASNQGGQASRVAAKKKPVVKLPLANAGIAPIYADGSYKGPIVDAYYGLMQVQANITGGQLVSVDILQYPKDRRTSRSINSQALPILQSEVIAAQTTHVDLVSGATLTSEAFLRSLTAALTQAGNGA